MLGIYLLPKFRLHTSSSQTVEQYIKTTFCNILSNNISSHFLLVKDTKEEQYLRTTITTMKCKCSTVFILFVFGLTIAQTLAEEDAFDDLEGAASEEDLSVAESVGGGGGKGGAAAGKAGAAAGAVGAFAKGIISGHHLIVQ